MSDRVPLYWYRYLHFRRLRVKRVRNVRNPVSAFLHKITQGTFYWLRDHLVALRLAERDHGDICETFVVLYCQTDMLLIHIIMYCASYYLFLTWGFAEEL